MYLLLFLYARGGEKKNQKQSNNSRFYNSFPHSSRPDPSIILFVIENPQVCESEWCTLEEFYGVRWYNSVSTADTVQRVPGVIIVIIM